MKIIYMSYSVHHFKSLKEYLFLITMLRIIKTNFLRRGRIENDNVIIDGKKFFDQPINDLIKQYDEVRKVTTGQVQDYATGCLLDHGYFKDYYRLISVDLSKQKALDADQRAVKQIVFQGKAGQKIRLYTILEKSKETFLQLYRETAKFCE